MFDLSPGGDYHVKLFKGKIDAETYFLKHFCVNIFGSRDDRWVSTPENLFIEVKLLEFLNFRSLLFAGMTKTWGASHLLDLPSGKVRMIGPGKANMIGLERKSLCGAVEWRRNSDPLFRRER